MQVSAAIRWFWPGQPPADMIRWFNDTGKGVCAAGGGQRRDDVYLLDPAQTELSIRRRGTHPGVEVKGLVAVTPKGLAVGPFAGPVETWAKWTTLELQLPAFQTVKVSKTRRRRTFDTTTQKPVEIPLGPDEAPLDRGRPPAVSECHVELGEVAHPFGVWWTFALESFGPLGSVEPHLWSVAAVLAARGAALPPGGFLAGYPAWLSKMSRSARAHPVSPAPFPRPRL